jgi:hypothetical protein
MQNVADGHDTLVSAAFGGPLGPGVVCVAHVAADADEATPTASAAQSTAILRIQVPIPITIP